MLDAFKNEIKVDDTVIQVNRQGSSLWFTISRVIVAEKTRVKIEHLVTSNVCLWGPCRRRSIRKHAWLHAQENVTVINGVDVAPMLARALEEQR
jgi:hypothetical protein